MEENDLVQSNSDLCQSGRLHIATADGDHLDPTGQLWWYHMLAGRFEAACRSTTPAASPPYPTPTASGTARPSSAATYAIHMTGTFLAEPDRQPHPERRSRRVNDSRTEPSHFINERTVPGKPGVIDIAATPAYLAIMEAISITAERKAQLDDFARRHGEDAATALDHALSEYLAWEQDDFEDAVAHIREGWEDMNAGRVLPAEEVFERLSRKHGLSRKP